MKKLAYLQIFFRNKIDIDNKLGSKIFYAEV